MSARAKITDLIGEWAGSSRLWLFPGATVRESETTASVAPAAGGAFLIINYRWEDEGTPQDGILLVRLSVEPGTCDMVWIDSWHTGGEFMVFRGEEDRDGSMSAVASYAAPPGPDWGWRIVLSAESETEMRITMYNITPDGNEALAVEAMYERMAPRD